MIMTSFVEMGRPGLGVRERGSRADEENHKTRPQSAGV